MPGEAVRVTPKQTGDTLHAIRQAANDGAATIVQPKRRRRSSEFLRRVAKEPLTHFIVAGALIFAASHAWEAHNSRYNLVLGPEDVQRLALTYAQQYGTLPTRPELKSLTEGYLREEILRREGVAIGLDRDDEIVSRRIAQKFEFLLQDRASPRPPSASDLAAWYAAHAAAYTDPARRSFDQLYYTADGRGDAQARQLAEAAAIALGRGERPPPPDSFPGTQQIRLLSRADTDRLFGGDGFAAQVFAAPTDRWSGPWRSAFGWHLVRVTEAEPERRRSYAEVADRVAADWQVAERKRLNERAFDEVRANYRITLPAALQ